MARRGRACVAPGCERRAAPGSVVCAEHRWTALGAETDREIVQLTQRFEAMSRVEDAEARREAVSTFRTQLERGEYAALKSAQMLQMLDESGGELDLTREIGMLRIAMLRVLSEEEQPSRMAHALAKLSFAMGRTMKLQEEWTGGNAQDASLAQTLNEILIDLEKENREKREPWKMDPYNPSELMIEDLRKVGLEPGTTAAAMWIERWQVEQTKELAARGNREAQLRLANGAVVGLVLGSGEG